MHKSLRDQRKHFLQRVTLIIHASPEHSVLRSLTVVLLVKVQEDTNAGSQST